MNVRFLGVGGAFDPEFGNSSAVVESGGSTFTLIDCGATVYQRLKQSGWIDRLTHVLITHLHDDHVGSLGSMIYHRYYITGRKIELVFPPGLRHPLMTLLGQQHTSGPVDERVNLRELSADPNSPSRIIGTTQVDWLDTTGRHQANMPTFAYIFRNATDTIAYSGDLGDPDFLFQALESRSISKATVFHDTFFHKVASSPHAWYKDLERHLDRWEILGYHNNPHQKPADCRLPLVFEDPAYSPEDLSRHP